MILFIKSLKVLKKLKKNIKFPFHIPGPFPEAKIKF